MTHLSKEHENWVRYYCLELAVKNKPFQSAEQHVKTAQCYAQFVKDDKKVSVLKLVNP